MAQNGSALPQDATNVDDTFAESKGKGKAVAEDVPADAGMEEEDDDDDDDDDDDEEEDAPPEAAEEDGMEEIDLNNIVEGGRRTRGQVIDFAKAAEQHPADDEDEDDDDDFQPPSEDVEMSG